MGGYERVVEALRERDLLAPSWGGGQRALCPSHNDTRPSLSVGEGDDGRALVYCHAGCAVADVVAALDLDMGDLFASPAGRGHPTVSIYTYVDEDGHPLFRVCRTDPKGFYQERLEEGEWKPGLRDTRRVIYRLPEVLRAAASGMAVYVVEGEKDVERLEDEGQVATCVPGGAAKWRDEYAPFFKGARVFIIGDRDDDDANGYNPGQSHVSRVRLGVLDVASEVSVLWPAVGTHDTTDHLDNGYTLDELVTEETDLGIFAPVDWTDFDPEETEWLFHPWVPREGRVLAFGAAGSLKSLWAMWLAARLSREGKRVAYFSMEMTPSKTVARLKQLDPDPKNFVCFTRNLDLTQPNHIDKIILGLRGYDLIVIDSWTAVHQFTKRMSQNDEVAMLDRDVFIPIIEQTGASIMILDNTGHDVIADDGGKVKQAHARGASAKGDKMEVTLWLDRPDSSNNYRTRITCTKMRLNEPAPAPVVVETPRDRIEFYLVEQGVMTGTPMWPSLQVDVSSVASPEPEPDAVVAVEDMSLKDRLAFARLEHHFKPVQKEE